MGGYGGWVGGGWMYTEQGTSMREEQKVGRSCLCPHPQGQRVLQTFKQEDQCVPGIPETGAWSDHEDFTHPRKMFSAWAGCAKLGRKARKQVGQVHTPQNIHKACKCEQSLQQPSCLRPSGPADVGALSKYSLLFPFSLPPLPSLWWEEDAKLDSGPELPP